MYYPWLDVPYLTAPMLIAVIALLHVFVSHYAVGGGLLLARENSYALRKEDAAYRQYWKKHAKFFILLTVPYGAITGVGIWFTIGLSSPLATETLIRTFVFGWAIEWCFFLLEIVAGFALYYFWDKFGRKASSFAGWLYAFSAWLSLVLITGITSFMLNSSGLIADWESTGDFWHAFLNVQFLPQMIARTGCALTLGTFYVMAHATWSEKNFDVREQVVKRMRAPAFLGIFLLACGIAGWLFFLPESSRLTLERAAATNIFAGLFLAIIAGIVLLLIVGPCFRPRETSFGAALALLLMGVAGVGVAEFVREAVRKPYVVDRVVYGNQIYRKDVAKLRGVGYLYTGTWTSYELDKLQEKYPDLTISAERYLGVPTTRLAAPPWLTPKPGDEAVETKEAPADGGTPTDDGSSEVPDNSQTRVGAKFYLETVAYQQAPQGGVTRFSPVATSADAGAQSAFSSALPTLPEANSPSATTQSASNLPAIPASGNAPISDAASSLQGEPDLTSVDDNVDELANATQPLESVSGDISEEIDRAKSPAELDLEINGPISQGNLDLLKVEKEDRLSLGRMVFLHHCNSCHAAEHGYSAVAPMISGKSAAELKDFAMRLNHSHFYMPPWSGVEVEAELLGEYLESLGAKVPNNVFMKDKPKKERVVEETTTDAEAESTHSATPTPSEDANAELLE